jgi:hypothetical protein
VKISASVPCAAHRGEAAQSGMHPHTINDHLESRMTVNSYLLQNAVCGVSHG